MVYKIISTTFQTIGEQENMLRELQELLDSQNMQEVTSYN